MSSDKEIASLSDVPQVELPDTLLAAALRKQGIHRMLTYQGVLEFKMHTACCLKGPNLTIGGLFGFALLLFLFSFLMLCILIPKLLDPTETSPHSDMMGLSIAAIVFLLQLIGLAIGWLFVPPTKLWHRKVISNDSSLDMLQVPTELRVLLERVREQLPKVKVFAYHYGVLPVSKHAEKYCVEKCLPVFLKMRFQGSGYYVAAWEIDQSSVKGE